MRKPSVPWVSERGADSCLGESTFGVFREKHFRKVVCTPPLVFQGLQVVNNIAIESFAFE
jgi:hypothetical protein